MSTADSDHASRRSWIHLASGGHRVVCDDRRHCGQFMCSVHVVFIGLCIRRLLEKKSSGDLHVVELHLEILFRYVFCSCPCFVGRWEGTTEDSKQLCESVGDSSCTDFAPASLVRVVQFPCQDLL